MEAGRTRSTRNNTRDAYSLDLRLACEGNTRNTRFFHRWLNGVKTDESKASFALDSRRVTEVHAGVTALNRRVKWAKFYYYYCYFPSGRVNGVGVRKKKN